MTHLKIKTLTTPNTDLDLTKIIEIALGIFGFLIAYFKWVDSYFKSKKMEKQEFIENVVRSVISSSLTEYRREFTEFRDKMDIEINKFNATAHEFSTTVNDIYKEMRKP